MKKENLNRISVWIAIDTEACSIRTPERDTFSVKPLPVWEFSYSVGTSTGNLGAARRSSTIMVTHNEHLPSPYEIPLETFNYHTTKWRTD
jgi:hypothetical protein